MGEQATAYRVDPDKNNPHRDRPLLFVHEGEMGLGTVADLARHLEHDQASDEGVPAVYAPDWADELRLLHYTVHGEPLGGGDVAPREVVVRFPDGATASGFYLARNC